MIGDLFPRLHVRPATGWINDPNGIGYWDGAWHVMFQYNPYASVWGDIRWGHMTSTDLVSWQEVPVALAPRPGTIDASGIWSGVATLENGRPTLVYTAIPHEGGATLAARVALARENGAASWQQSDVAVTDQAPENVRDVRDPFLFSFNGRRLAVQGAGTLDGTPLVLLYDASDLDHWTYLGELFRGDSQLARDLAPGQLYECPQLVQVDGHWILVLSLWDDALPGSSDFGPQRTVWLSGELVPHGEPADGAVPHPAALTFVPTSGGPLDSGTAFYAPQIVIDSSTDRTLSWGWSWEGTRSEPPLEAPEREWAGILTFPRELRVENGVVASAPAPEVLAAFDVESTPSAIETTSVWLASLDPQGQPLRVMISLVGSAGERAVWTSPLAVEQVLVIVDGSIMEAYVDGQASTERVYPRADEVWRISATDASGEAHVPSLRTSSLAN